MSAVRTPSQGTVCLTHLDQAANDILGELRFTPELCAWIKDHCFDLQHQPPHRTTSSSVGVWK
jgi:hypothetical protein